ncbi:hypothetical protein RFI_24916 [Reticulomyxa filosa]|uniref:Uncharacterized protein n=1 Tax=Reticulomyxa filosa TaxID=46433 RepID=X6MHC8_RETFI|nr:hypothetical protein RFI_24916 [Reticulomyxa filosa]|eukprot:ETO12460.1 hypothetical protein RFI_24916 [Reticulomyxa filosa]
MVTEKTKQDEKEKPTISALNKNQIHKPLSRSQSDLSWQRQDETLSDDSEDDDDMNETEEEDKEDFLCAIESNAILRSKDVNVLDLQAFAFEEAKTPIADVFLRTQKSDEQKQLTPTKTVIIESPSLMIASAKPLKSLTTRIQ